MIFTRFLVKNDLFPVYRVRSPVYTEPKKPQKTLMRYQGFSVFFTPNPSIWDLQNHQNRWFCLPPPKIIKNRWNFALSEKFVEIRDFTPNLANLANFLVPRWNLTPPKIIKNRWNFALSDIRENTLKPCFIQNFLEIILTISSKKTNHLFIWK